MTGVPRPCESTFGMAVLFIAFSAGAVSGAGVRDLEDAWLVRAPAVVALLADSSSASGSWLVAAGQGRLYGMPELEQAGLDLQHRWASGMASASWQRLGGALYRESIWRAALLPGRSWRLGGRVSMSTLEVAGERFDRQIEADLAAWIPLSREVLLKLWWPLMPAPAWYGEHGLRRWLQLQGGGDSWAWAAVADRASGGAPSLQGEVLLKVAPRAALGLRGEPATGTIGICTAWRTTRLLLRTSHTMHPDLGTTHRWGLILGAGQ